MNLQKYYEKVAQKHGVSVDEVKREINLLIRQTWQNAAPGSPAAALQGQVPKAGDIPTDEEVIRFIMWQMQKVR